MGSTTLQAALARLDAMDATLATLRLLAEAYREEGDGGDHVAEYLGFAVSDAAADLAAIAKARRVDSVA